MLTVSIPAGIPRAAGESGHFYFGETGHFYLGTTRELVTSRLIGRCRGACSSYAQHWHCESRSRAGHGPARYDGDVGARSSRAAAPVVETSLLGLARGTLRRAARERPAVGRRRRLLKRRLGPTDSQSDAHPSRNAHRFSGCVARRKPSSRNTRPHSFRRRESARGRRCLLLRKAVRL